MKVLHVETGQHLYGGAKQVYFLLNGLRSKDVESLLCCPKNAAIGKAAEEIGIETHYTSSAGDLDFGFYQELKDIIKKCQPDLIHLHSRRGADVLGGIAAKMCGVPSVLSRRVDNPEKPWVVKIKYKLYEKVITISEGIKKVLVSEGVPQDKIHCVLSAVDAQTYQTPKTRAEFEEEFDLDEDTLTVGIVAQLIHRKGHRHLFRALSNIKETLPDIRILIFGQGPKERELKMLAESLDVDDLTSFEGFRDDLENWLGLLDLVVHPADMEGLGVSLLQAASAGVPIIGSRAGGIPEIVKDGENGLLFEPGNSQQLEQHLTNLLHNQDLRQKMGMNGRKIAEHVFSIETMVEGNLAVYKNILS